MASARALVEQSNRVILASATDPKVDIAHERQRATFDSTELGYFLNGGKRKVERRAELVKVLEKTSFGNKKNRYFLSHVEEYVGGLQAALGIWDLMQKEGYSLEDGLMMRNLLFWPGGLELHIGMFIPTLLSQADPEQQAHWLPLAQSLKIIGTYAQTELGHGTFVRGLETTATYDPSTQEFIIHSPNLTSTKWWPGGLAKTSTHCVLMARLFVKGRDYGPHSFIVQIRSLEDHKALPGITIGSIGPKFGYQGVDNGYLQFDHVHIPRQHMLMRYSQVTPDGAYVAPPAANAKAAYATMVYVRATIVRDAGELLGRAVTIATRYTAVRRQTAARQGERELQVLDYQNTSNVLLPLVASSYALWFMGRTMMDMYHQFEKDRDRGDFAVLPELHALSSGLKAVCTWVTADGIEACRQACGGHGYSLLSGLPTLLASYVQNVTWEGDNNVMCLQTARFLVKSLMSVLSGKQLVGSARYLEGLEGERAAKCAAACPDCWTKPHIVLAALRHRAVRLVVDAADRLRQLGNGHLTFEGPAWNSCTVDLIRAAKAHCAVVLQQTFVDYVARAEGKGEVRPDAAAVLKRLAALFGTDTLLKGAADLLEDGYATGQQTQWLRDAHYSLMLELRPNAVALVDAFAFEDYLLNSALGRADGDVYAALLEMAQAAPLNATEEGPAWKGVLEPVMKAGEVKARL